MIQKSLHQRIFGNRFSRLERIINVKIQEPLNKNPQIFLLNQTKYPNFVVINTNLKYNKIPKTVRLIKTLKKFIFHDFVKYMRAFRRNNKQEDYIQEKKIMEKERVELMFNI